MYVSSEGGRGWLVGAGSPKEVEEVEEAVSAGLPTALLGGKVFGRTSGRPDWRTGWNGRENSYCCVVREALHKLGHAGGLNLHKAEWVFCTPAETYNSYFQFLPLSPSVSSLVSSLLWLWKTGCWLLMLTWVDRGGPGPASFLRGACDTARRFLDGEVFTTYKRKKDQWTVLNSDIMGSMLVSGHECALTGGEALHRVWQCNPGAKMHSIICLWLCLLNGLNGSMLTHIICSWQDIKWASKARNRSHGGSSQQELPNYYCMATVVICAASQGSSAHTRAHRPCLHLALTFLFSGPTAAGSTSLHTCIRICLNMYLKWSDVIQIQHIISVCLDQMHCCFWRGGNTLLDPRLPKMKPK